jgi:glycosyltransferase involved in cell wall biosynthesis
MDKRLKIGIFIDGFFPMIDGVINVVDNYAKRLNEIADVTVFAPYGRDKKYPDNFSYKVVRCKRLKLFFLDYDLPMPGFDRKFKKILKQSDLDIIHIHSPFSLGKQAVKYAKRNKIPIVGTMHSQFKKDFLRATKSKLLTKIMLKKIMKVYNACDECWAVNNKMAQVFKEYGAKKLPGIMNNGTNLKPIDAKAATKLINTTYNINKDTPVYCFVGRINLLKNILFTVDALKIVKEKGHDFRMLFMGSGQDSEKLKNYIAKNNLQNEIIICGRVSDEILVAGYSRSRLFLFPSLYDASSLVQIEAASQKTPAVFLQGAATADTVTNDVNGFIVPNDVGAFADKIIEATVNKEYYNKISEGAFRDLYRSWDDVIKEVYQRYLKIISGKKKC